MFNFHAVLMTADSITNHKQFPVDNRVIFRIELPTPRLTRLTETITNSLRRAHTTTKAKSVLALPLIKRNEAHLPAPNANYLLLVHTKTLAVFNKRLWVLEGREKGLVTRQLSNAKGLLGFGRGRVLRYRLSTPYAAKDYTVTR
jgi:hypothetical protein